ncbi:VCBS repeat-containing protein [Candidatus Acetothermia bacterium]|nr:VCBS repeat-containing protein [Candidatus Acetothermia bacterium]MCI2432379.1 VCBS repeat-containing protein [Candidatus Acetothermia bacterium]MCI2435795.1 VCBS repeat-containing protein [Candidatus Acetothermia bacterium]
MRKYKFMGIGSVVLLLAVGLSAPGQAPSPSCEPPAPLAIGKIPERFAILGLAPQAVAIEDFNRDGRLDFVVSYLRCDPEQRPLDPVGCGEEDRNGRVVLLLGQEEGFLPAERAARVVTRESPRFMTVGDFNGDCFPDLAVANLGSPGGRGSLSVLLNNREGSFSFARPLELEGNARGIVAADFNKDGHLDLAVVISSRRMVTVLWGDGKGRFDSTLDLATGSGPQTIVAADFNGDGFLDLATANASSSESVTILLNDQKGDFRAAAPLVIDDSPFDLAAGDLNGDGFVDIVTTHAAATDSLWVWLGDGQGNFTLKERFPAGSDPIRLLLADINADGRLDAISVNGVANQVNIFLGDGQGNLGAPRALEVGQTPLAVTVADLNRDGLVDLITANSTSNDISIWVQPRAP